MDDNVIVFYFSDAPLPGDVFCTIAQELVKWEQGRDYFRYFHVDRESGHNRVVDKKGELTLAELLKAAHGRNDPAYQLYTMPSYRCWWDSEGKMEQLTTALYLYTRGVDWHKNSKIDFRIEGVARLYLPLEPYNELLSGKNPRQEEINQHTEENLESLSEFVMHLGRAVGASSVKMYAGEVFCMPLNASFAYYRDTQALLDDLRFISELWERGLPAYKVGALKDGNAKDLETVIYEKRSAKWSTRADWGDRVLEDLKALLPIKAMPTAEDVDRVLKSGRHDNYRNGESFTVLDYPFYMNSMLDPFFIDVLKQAAGIPLERPDDVYIEEGE